jgi:hypothetical protein
MEIPDWYQVRFDERGFYRAAQPPGQAPWDDFVAWEAVIRVCLEVEEFSGSDGLYVFTRDRPESYALPLEAAGGPELLGELVRRGLFDGPLAERAASAVSGLFCWPEGPDLGGPPGEYDDQYDFGPEEPDFPGDSASNGSGRPLEN